jgi:hypothetical protein
VGCEREQRFRACWFALNAAQPRTRPNSGISRLRFREPEKLKTDPAALLLDDQRTGS